MEQESHSFHLNRFKKFCKEPFLQYGQHVIARELVIKTLDYMDASQIKALNDSDNDLRFLAMRPEQIMIFADIIDRERAKLSTLAEIDVGGEWAQGEKENREVRERIFRLYL